MTTVDLYFLAVVHDTINTQSLAHQQCIVEYCTNALLVYCTCVAIQAVYRNYMLTLV